MESEAIPQSPTQAESDRATPSPATPPAAPPPASPAAARTADTPWIIGIWRRLLREPALFFSVAYVFVSFIGLWASYWYYRAFGVPILEYMQGSDYLVAGLRDPMYALWVALAVLLSWLASAPELWRKRHPQRTEALRRHWWGRALFPNSKWLRWCGLTPETGIALSSFIVIVTLLTSSVVSRSVLIRDELKGHAVRVTLAGDAAPLPDEARLLGTSSGFVFLWWPQQRHAEAVPIESIGRLQALPVRQSRKAVPKPVPSAPAKR